MAVEETRQHPNDALGIDPDAPRPIPSGDAPAAEQSAEQSGPRHFKAYNLKTDDFVGFLGTYGNNADLVQSESDAPDLAWSPSGSDMYLQKVGSTNRYLGLGWNGYASWGLWTPTGWADAVIPNADGTISLASEPGRKLYGPYKNGWVCWSDASDTGNQNILRFDWGQ